MSPGAFVRISTVSSVLDGVKSVRLYDSPTINAVGSRPVPESGRLDDGRVAVVLESKMHDGIEFTRVMCGPSIGWCKSDFLEAARP